MRPVPAVAELRRICQKDESVYGAVPPISKHLIHPYVSIYLTRMFLLLGVHGDTVTLLMALAGIAGAFCFLGQGAVWRLAGCLLLIASWILDHSDGEVLRYQGRSSAYGILLDRLTHVIEHPAMHFCLGWSLGAADPLWRLLGSLNALAVLMLLCIRLEVKSLPNFRRTPARRAPARRGLQGLLRRALGFYRGTAMQGYGPVVVAGLLLSILAGWLPEYFLLLSLSLYANVGLTLFLVLARARRQAAAAPAAPSRALEPGSALLPQDAANVRGA
jgi:phosphatidylglycerophosphate synthase